MSLAEPLVLFVEKLHTVRVRPRHNYTVIVPVLNTKICLH